MVSKNFLRKDFYQQISEDQSETSDDHFCSVGKPIFQSTSDIDIKIDVGAHIVGRCNFKLADHNAVIGDRLTCFFVIIVISETCDLKLNA